MWHFKVCWLDLTNFFCNCLMFRSCFAELLLMCCTAHQCYVLLFVVKALLRDEDCDVLRLMVMETDWYTTSRMKVSCFDDCHCKLVFLFRQIQETTNQILTKVITAAMIVLVVMHLVIYIVSVKNLSKICVVVVVMVAAVYRTF